MEKGEFNFYNRMYKNIIEQRRDITEKRKEKDRQKLEQISFYKKKPIELSFADEKQKFERVVSDININQKSFFKVTHSLAQRQKEKLESTTLDCKNVNYLSERESMCQYTM